MRRPKRQSAMRSARVSTSERVRLLCCVAWSVTVMTFAAAAEFEPYQLNGGLVAAVAGRDFVVLSTDTRLMGPSGYDILERNHVKSRLWAATDARSASLQLNLLNPDGSVRFEAPSTVETTNSGELIVHASTKLVYAPTFVGSSGCNADCEMLKRTVRADTRAAFYHGESDIQTAAVATLLGQMLYSRRGFPFYSFCVVGGMENGAGKVYVYDAIGSYEQVGVATSGTGRELLQPILDRSFRSREVFRSTIEFELPKQVMLTVAPRQVDCSKDEAISKLVDGYRSVSERDIGVGDRVVFCCIQQLSDGTFQCEVSSTALKKH